MAAPVPSSMPTPTAAVAGSGTGWPPHPPHPPESAANTAEPAATEPATVEPSADGERDHGLATLGAPGWPPSEPSPSAGSAAAARPAGPRTPIGSIWTKPEAVNGAEPEEDQPFARVDARKLEAALLSLRRPIVSAPLSLEAPGVAEARVERVKLLSQIDDYLLPRLRQSGAPILVALVGSTGAGKSTLLNTVAGKKVSATGIRRPTTNSPVLACHPDDMRWFAENVFLPTLPRVRQQGLAMPGRDGLLVLAATEGMPPGVAVLDTPDIDSVVQAHRDFAHQFLDASDLWLFVTTARRYADAAVWEMLQDARDRGAALAVALSRVPPAATAELTAHFEAMLEANGLREERRFIIPETTIDDSRLPTEVAAPVRDWLADTARREDRRVAVLTQTMSGVLDTFRSRVPALADQVAEQLVLRRQLREAVDTVFGGALAEFDEMISDGSLAQGEVLARWQDFAGTGDLLRILQVRRGRGAARQKRQGMPARATALKEALQASAESLIAATADRAAERVVDRWRQHSAGAGLLAAMGPEDAVGSAASSEEDFVATALADLGLVSGTGDDPEHSDPAALARATSGLMPAAERAVTDWLAHVAHLVRAENVTKRSIARVVTFDEVPLALVLTVGVLSRAAADGPASEDGAGTSDTATVAPQRLLESLFGAGSLRDMGTRIRSDLHERVSELLAAEAERFFAVIDSAGVSDESAATVLLQAGYALEEAR
jgi:energy-coupling factor transporter ATP-binding protein EcfA2